MLEQTQNMKMKAIIVDIDGTIALHNNRGPFEYDKCDTDTPNKPIIEIVKKFQADKYLRIIYLSGREDSCMEKTRAWITKHTGQQPQLLFMRKTGDHRKDSIIKKEIYEAQIKPHHKVIFVLDDRNQVVEMWRQEGLTCLQVADGDF